MKKIVIIIALLFGFNSYAMKERLQQGNNIDYKTLSYKIDSITQKAETKPLKRKSSVFKRIVQIFQIVVLLFLLFILIAIRI